MLNLVIQYKMVYHHYNHEGLWKTQLLSGSIFLGNCDFIQENIPFNLVMRKR